MIQLNGNVVIAIPSTGDPGLESMDQVMDRRSRNVARMLSGLFGGATIINGLGLWISPQNDDLITEGVKLVISFCGAEDLEETRSGLISYCARLADLWDQDAIALLLDGSLLLVGKDDIQEGHDPDRYFPIGKGAQIADLVLEGAQ